MNRVWILILGVGIALSWGAKPTVHWQEYHQALKTAEQHQMLVFVDIYADWCVPCKIMERTTYQDSAVVHLLNTYFLPVKLDADSDAIISCNNWPRSVAQCVTDNWRLRGVPSIALIGPQGNYILSITQGITPEQMQLLLNDFHENRQTLIDSEPQQVP